MASRLDREKQKSSQDKHQMILSALLKDEDNKYCVDCDAKGPRWAAWNLGIFLCIRCAGIHRNLGVHITRVKSVNLDSWTAEHIAMMQEMGNSRARAVYEANLPDNFRRPQTDSGLEAFIRAKYETKKYIAQEWIPPQPKFKPMIEEPAKKEKKKNRPRPSSSIQLNNVPAPAKSVPNSTKTETKSTGGSTKTVKETKPAATVDLLGLDAPAAPAPSHTNTSNNDLFGDFMSSNTATADSSLQPNSAATPGNTGAAGSTTESSSNGLADVNLFEESNSTQEKQKATKESILALYGSSGGGQMFGVPGGMYMPQQTAQQQQQQPQQQQMWAAGGGNMQNGMMPSSQANMNMQGNIAAGIQANSMMGGVQQQGMVVGQLQGVGGPAAGNSQGMVPQGMVPGMYNMPAGMYGMPQQQVQQVQNQMTAMNLGGASMGAIQQPGLVAAGGTTGANWGGQASGQTLSTNLWQ